MITKELVISKFRFNNGFPPVRLKNHITHKVTQWFNFDTLLNNIVGEELKTHTSTFISNLPAIYAGKDKQSCATFARITAKYGIGITLDK